MFSVCALETTKSATESVFSFFRAVRLETDSWKVVRALLLRRESEHTHTFREITLWPRAQIQPSSGRIIHGLCVHFFCVLYYGFFSFWAVYNFKRVQQHQQRGERGRWMIMTRRVLNVASSPSKQWIKT